MRTGSGARLLAWVGGAGGTSPAAAADSSRLGPGSPTGGGDVTDSDAEVKGQPPEEGDALVATCGERTELLPLPPRPTAPGPDAARDVG